MNCVKPEISAFRFFWPRLSPGGVVILDDYGFKDHRRQKEAFDSLSKALNFKIIQLPTGQGLIIKPCVPPIK
jgi:predicted O-methyltransferase YrrM